MPCSTISSLASSTSSFANENVKYNIKMNPRIRNFKGDIGSNADIKHEIA